MGSGWFIASRCQAGSRERDRSAWFTPAFGALLALALVLAACSGADNSDVPLEAPATASAAATSTSAPSPSPTLTVPPATATAEPTATTALPTATATVAPTATATATTIATPSPSPTASEAPLPAGGAEARILGKAIQRVVPGDENGEILYAITAVGVARSPDGGKSWSASGETPEGTMVAALNNPDVLYAGDNGSCARGKSETPIVRSVDGGLTWETFEAGTSVRPLLVEAGQNSTVIGTDCRLQVSFNGGQTWEAVPGAENYDIYAAASSNPNALDDHIVVLGVSEGGTSIAWLVDMSGNEPVAEGEIARFYGLGAIAWSGERIVLATSTGVGVSDDAGATWSWSRDGLEAVTFSVDPTTDAIPPDEQGKPFGFSFVRVSPENADEVWIGGPLGAHWSADGGGTWRQLGDESSVDSLVVSTVSERVFVSADGGTRVWTLDGQ